MTRPQFMATLQMPPTEDDALQTPYLEVERVEKWFKSAMVLDSLDLAVNHGEFISLLGPSGCGKTTLLRLVAGLLRPNAGRIVLDGRNLTEIPAHRRNIGVVFQNYALFPHLTVAENVAFGLKAKRLPKEEIRRAVAAALSTVRLAEFGDRSIMALSGGQQQRVAVARAVVVEPALLLLDEPFGALDRKLRETMQIELRSLLRSLGITSIFVTHDQEEALILSDRIAVMQNGRIEQLADPHTIYHRPATPFVLDFVGTSTQVSGRIVTQVADDARIETPYGTIRAKTKLPSGTRVLVAVRPEDIVVDPSDDTQLNSIPLTVREFAFLGSKTLIHFDVADGDSAIAEISSRQAATLEPGSVVSMAWPVEATLVYSTA